MKRFFQDEDPGRFGAGFGWRRGRLRFGFESREVGLDEPRKGIDGRGRVRAVGPETAGIAGLGVGREQGKDAARVGRSAGAEVRP